MRERAIGVLRPFICVNVGRDKLISDGRAFHKNISLIQKRIKDMLACRFGKVEILINYWDKMLGKL
jgi:hypothetical protein